METDFEALKKKYLSEMMQYQPPSSSQDTERPDVLKESADPQPLGLKTSDDSNLPGDYALETKMDPSASFSLKEIPREKSSLESTLPSEWTPVPAKDAKSFRTETPLLYNEIDGSFSGEQNLEDTDTAFLVVQVSTADEAMPVSEAYVTVTRERNEEEILVRFALTDQSGKTPVMALPALPAELSEESGNPHPYVSYNIRTDHQGYYSVKNIHVPVFGGITSIQPVEMVPVPEKEDDNKEMLVLESQAPGL